MVTEARPNRDPALRRFPESSPSIRSEMEAFGNRIWKGAPLEVMRDVILRPQQAANVTVLITPDSLPANISQEAMELVLRPHIRSRWAHVSLDAAKESVEQLVANLQTARKHPEGSLVQIRMVNHGSHPLMLQGRKEAGSREPVTPGDKPLHFYIVPDAARIRGTELNEMIGDTDKHPIQVFGKENTDWKRHYEVIDGERVFDGLYLRIDENEKYWIPGSSEPIVLPRFSNFEHARKWLFKHLFKRADDKRFPMPRNHIWVGKLVPLKVGNGMYAELDENAYVDIGNSEFIRKGLQTHSPLLEGRAQSFHVEVKGPAHWALVRFVRNGDQLVAG